MKKIKILSLTITSLVLAGVMTTQTVQAKTSTSTTSIQSSSKTNVSSNTLETIQQNYLGQNDDGTFYISDSAYGVIDKDTLDLIKTKIDSINIHILNQELKFKIVKNGNKTEVINTVDNVPVEIKNAFLGQQTQSSGGVSIQSTGHIFNYDYCSCWYWSWYGFETYVNEEGTKLLRNYLDISIAVTGSTGTLAACVPGGQAIAVALVGYSMTTIASRGQCSDGIDNHKGVYVKAIGSPDDATMYSIKAVY